MPHKHLLVRSEAREKVLHGAAALTDAMKVTLGPRSKCVLIEKKWGKPLVCNDGVTIAREFDLKDPEENLGAQMIRQAAEHTGEAVGDGTTTSTLLAYAILADGVRNVAAGASAIQIKRGLDRGLRAAVGALKQLSRPVTTKVERAQVATISAHNDPTIGDLVADALEKVGAEGSTTVEEAKGTDTTLEVVEGMQFDRGYLSPYFVNDTAKMQVILEDPRIFLYDRKVVSVKDVLPLLEQLVQAHHALLVIAEDVEADALATFVVNRIRGVLSCAAVKAPGFGDRRRALLDDIAILTGGRVISQDIGVKLENVTLADLGRARRIIIDQDSTTIIGGAGAREAIQQRCDDLRRQIVEAKSGYDKEKLEERLAKLTGGVAVVRVGAPSEAEMKNRKEAVEDAISATKAAAAEGIVPGGGLALLRAIDAVQTEAAACEGDERTGVLILEHALEAPARQIADNSGVDGGVVVDHMRTSQDALGFDAARCQYVDLFAAGIVDPTKVVRVALENAVSVAGVLLLTEATLTDIEEPAAATTSSPVEV